MNYQKTGLVLLAVVAAIWFKGGFATMPNMTRAGTSLRVGGESDDTHARYEVAESADFEATSVGYDFNGGGSQVCKLGSRAILSWIASDAYAAASAVSCRTGQCMAGFLNDAEGRGRIGHYLLIPNDKTVLSQMRAMKLPMGKRFRLVGNFLDYQSGAVEGHAFDGRVGNIRYFLVTSIESR